MNSPVRARLFGEPDAPIVCGHRGVPEHEPENTLPSFRLAAEQGATWVEFDVRPSADGELVIHHDPDTSSGVHIASTARSGLDPSIPTFGDLARAESKLGFDIEMKTDGIDMSLQDYADLVVAQVQQFCSDRSEVMVTSFDAQVLELVRDRAPTLPTGLLFWDRRPSEAIAMAVDVGHVAVAPSIRLLDERLTDDAHAAGLGVATWTVNKPRHIRWAARVGADMIIGDDSARIIDVLASATDG